MLLETLHHVTQSLGNMQCNFFGWGREGRGGGGGGGAVLQKVKLNSTISMQRVITTKYVTLHIAKTPRMCDAVHFSRNMQCNSVVVCCWENFHYIT